MATTLKSATVKEVRDALAQLGAGHDNTPFEVWLPGSRILLGNTITLGTDAVLIEGNVKPGSALMESL